MKNSWLHICRCQLKLPKFHYKLKMFDLQMLLCTLPLCLGQMDSDCSSSTNPPSACASTNTYVPCEFNGNTGALQLVENGTLGTCTSPQMCFREIADKPATPCGNPPPACMAAGVFPYRIGKFNIKHVFFNIYYKRLYTKLSQK